jgi:hypothetical protein
MGGFTIVEDFFQGIDKAEHGTCIQAFAIDAGITQKSIISSEDECISIKEV